MNFAEARDVVEVLLCAADQHPSGRGLRGIYGAEGAIGFCHDRYNPAIDRAWVAAIGSSHLEAAYALIDKFGPRVLP